MSVRWQSDDGEQQSRRISKILQVSMRRAKQASEWRQERHALLDQSKVAASHWLGRWLL